MRVAPEPAAAVADDSSRPANASRVDSAASSQRDLRSALASVASWPVDAAAAAVVIRGRVVSSIGTTQQVFPLASVTKALTATAVLVAVEEGTLTLDQPAGPAGSTVAHLLAHASGLGPTGEVLAEPGTRRIYSNAGFEHLAQVLSDQAGMAFATYLHEAILLPLGMAHTELQGSAAHGATASVDDIATFIAALQQPGLVLSAATVGDATRNWFGVLPGVLPGYGQQPDNTWGLGFELRGMKQPHWTGHDNSPATFGHFGRSGTFLWIDPVNHAALVVLTDRDFGDWAIERWPKLSDAILRAVGASQVSP